MSKQPVSLLVKMILIIGLFAGLLYACGFTLTSCERHGTLVPKQGTTQTSYQIGTAP